MKIPPKTKKASLSTGLNVIRRPHAVIDILDTEPFNEDLDRRIWSLNAERMALDKELGDRRRKTPLDMERLVEDMLLDEPPSLDGDEEIVTIVMPDEGTIYIYMLIFFFY